MNNYAGTANNARRVNDALKVNSGCSDTSGYVFTDIVEDAEIRSAREQITGELYYSMVDVIFALREDYSHSESANYWSVMKHRLLKKRYIYDRINCHKVKVEAKDGKRRGTDFMNLDDAFFVLRKLSFCDDKEYLEEFLKKCANSKRTEDYY